MHADAGAHGRRAGACRRHRKLLARRARRAGARVHGGARRARVPRAPSDAARARAPARAGAPARARVWLAVCRARVHVGARVHSGARGLRVCVRRCGAARGRRAVAGARRRAVRRRRVRPARHPRGHAAPHAGHGGRARLRAAARARAVTRSALCFCALFGVAWVVYKGFAHVDTQLGRGDCIADVGRRATN